MTIDKRINYRSAGFISGRTKSSKSKSSQSKSPGHPGNQGGKSSTNKVTAKHSPHGGGPGTGYVPPKKKTTTVTTGGKSPFTHTTPPVIPKGRTYPGGIQSQWKNFLKHRMNTQQMKGKFTDIKGYKPSYVPNYTHALGGYDWKQNFPNSADWVDKGLAYGYQHLTELPKGIMNIDPMSSIFSDTGVVGSLSNAFNKANVEAAKNVQGFTGEGIPAETLEKYHNWQNLANGGIADLYRYGGYLG
jgi:hypothetical protein